MKIKLVRLTAFIFCVFAVSQANAQSGIPGLRDSRQPSDTDLNTRMRNTRRMTEPKGGEKYTPSKTKGIKIKLDVDKEDLSKYESFLKKPQTGIFKLLPLISCPEADKKALEKCDKERVSIKFFANAYSFRETNHSSMPESDLSLGKASLDVGRTAVQSLFGELGDVPLENLTLESDGVSFLANMKPEQTMDKVTEQFLEIEQGIAVGKYSFAKSLPVKENTTFALRSISYQGANLVSEGKHADVIVAFRVVRRDADGAITILWKELSRKSGAKLKS